MLQSIVDMQYRALSYGNWMDWWDRPYFQGSSNSFLQHFSMYSCINLAQRRRRKHLGGKDWFVTTTHFRHSPESRQRMNYLLLTLTFHQIIIIISVLPKGRSFMANSGNKAAILPKGRFSVANSGTQVAVLLGMNRCSSFPLLSAPHSLFSL